MKDWYKELSLLKHNLQSLQEDIPLNLREKNNINGKSLEVFNMQLTAMRSRLDRAWDELEKYENIK